MAYSGYHLKFNGIVFPYDYIRPTTYKSTPNQRMDVDSYRDTDGVLHRQALSHTATKIEWETPVMTNVQRAAMMSLINNAMINDAERRLSVTYYDEENDIYRTGTFYMPDVQFTAHHVDVGRNLIVYSPTRIALIEY